MKLRNDKILVFGGGSGIGKAVAKRLIDAGAKVLITGRSEEKLKLGAKKITAKIYFIRCLILPISAGIMRFLNMPKISLGDLTAL